MQKSTKLQLVREKATDGYYHLFPLDTRIRFNSLGWLTRNTYHERLGTLFPNLFEPLLPASLHPLQAKGLVIIQITIKDLT